MRDNKRRHRARQKEYTAELEAKVRTLQQDGVRATIEVQQAAKKVIHENTRLRALLRSVGMDEDTIDRSVAEQCGARSDEVDGWRQIICPRKGVSADPTAGDSRLQKHSAVSVVTASAPLLSQERINSALPASTERTEREPSDVYESLQASKEPLMPAEHNPPVNVTEPSFDTSQGSGHLKSQHRCRRISQSGTSVPEASSTSQPPAPCKLLTLVAADPGADITQIPRISDEGELDPVRVPGGISCSSAYRMLMHHATTESKVDVVAHVLEEGCTPSAEPGQGCMIKDKTIWKALDDIILQ